MRVLFALLLAFIVAGTAHAQTERRVALVIGAADYDHVADLSNAAADAQRIHEALATAGFSMPPPLLSPDKSTLDAALRDFGVRAAGADVALIYFAGHGMQQFDDNWIIPTDAQLLRPEDVQVEGVPLLFIQRFMSRAQLRVIILDACRNNPFSARWPGGRATTPGLLSMDGVPEGFVVAYSAGPNQIAPDDGAYARSLARRMQEEGLELRQVFSRVSEDLARGANAPEYRISLDTRQFYFRGSSLGTIISAPPWRPATQAELSRVSNILRSVPLVDGHNDLPWEIRESHQNSLDVVDLLSDTRQLQPPLHTDIPRLRRGGVGAQFWSVYVPSSFQGAAARDAVYEQIDLTRRMIDRYPDFEFANSAADIVRIHRAGRIASMFGIEGGDAINDNLAILRQFRATGVLYMTLTHQTSTDWADSATDAPRHGGLSPFGEDVIREMNRIGMLVDLSHVSADTMRDALRVSTVPVIFSHSSAYGATPHQRNVPDDVLRLVHQNGGVVMVNFYSAFVSESYRQWNATRQAEEARQRGLTADVARQSEGVATWRAAHPPPRVTVSDVADHVDYVGRIAGRENVGIGADFDGVPSLPEGLEGVDCYPNLLVELSRRGWSDAELAALAGGNLLRVLREAERISARH